MSGTVRLAVVVGTLFAVASLVNAQCGHWLSTGKVPGVEGSVKAMLDWDPDGEGPLPAVLVVGGSFKVAGDIVANNIAAWDGTAWHALGSGVTGTDPAVHALTTYNGRLIAAGSFASAGGVAAACVAAWDGTAWTPLGSGPLTSEYPNTVYALTLFEGKLYVGGNFQMPPGNSRSMAIWDGTSWSGLPAGTQFDYTTVRCFAVYNGQLHAGGNFSWPYGAGTNIWRWTGSTWENLGVSSFNIATVYAMTIYDGKLIAGGDFNGAGAANATSIAAWDGSSWSALGTGMPWSNGDHGVRSLIVQGQDLIAGGLFSQAGGVTAYDIAAWNGASWRAMGEGPGLTPCALATHEGQLFAGGGPVDTISHWDGTTWNPLHSGLRGTPEALASYHGELIAGGYLTTTAFPPEQNLVHWDGQSWQPLGAQPNGRVHALAVHNDQLFAGGTFTHIGTMVNNIARWNGAAWQSLAMGLNGGVYTMTSYDGELIVGGYFTNAGSVGVNCIARWNGLVWRGLGGGSSQDVRASTVYNGELVAAGMFTDSNGAESAIAAWNGSRWRRLPGVFTNNSGSARINALAVWDGKLVAGGDFLRVDGQHGPYTAQWNGSAWEAFPSSPPGTVYALQSYGRRLAAAARYGFRVWDGTSWERLAGGIDADVRALALHGDQLAVAGDFVMAGEVASSRVARWQTDSLVITQPPTSRTLNQSQAAAFTVAASGSGTLDYRWRKAGTPLVDDARISGSTTDRLVIHDLEPGDAGEYDVLAIDDCGPATSATATLAVTSWIPADLDRDHDVDQADAAIFQACLAGPILPYLEACPLAPDDDAKVIADFDADGDLDMTDFSILQRCFSGPVTPADPTCAD